MLKIERNANLLANFFVLQMFIFRSIRHLQEASATDGKGKFLLVLDSVP